MSAIRAYIPDKVFIKGYLYMALPLILQSLISASVKLIDNLMVGSMGDSQEIGEAAMAAVGAVNKVIFIPELAFVGVLAGFGMFTSQYFGDGNYDRVKQTLRAKVVGTLIFAILAVAVSYIFMDQIIQIFIDTENATEYAKTYYTYMLPYFFALGIAMSYSFTYREVGYTKIVIIASLTAIGTNTCLNYLLIGGNFGFPEWGVKGAAIATVIARTVEALILFFYAKAKNLMFYSKIKDMLKIDRELLTAAKGKVLFMLANEVTYAIVMTVVYYAYSTRGDDKLAAISIADTVNQFIFAFFSGVSIVVTLQVGKVLGEGDLKTANSNANKTLTTSIMLAAGVGLIGFIIAPIIVNIPLYNISDETRTLAMKLVFIDAASVPLFTACFCFYFIFRSGGDTLSMAMMDLGFVTLITMPVFLLMAWYTDLSLIQMKLVYSGLEILKLTFGIINFKRRVWLRKIV